MNKPAPKEPSMDEILSSIRQIIADDDAGTRRPSAAAAEAAVSPFDPGADADEDEESQPLELTANEMLAGEGEDAAPLELEAEAIVGAAPPGEPRPEEAEPEAARPGEPAAGGSEDPYADAELVEPDDVTFEAAAPEPPAPEAGPGAAPAPQPQPPPMPAAAAAPMPDATLSRDIAERLLEPATRAAVRHTFSRLNNLAIGAPTMTIEDMMRDLLRPMLKEWLDENLPAVVERMVEKEIERISRGT